MKIKNFIKAEKNFNNFIKYFYETEEYYFVLSYSLGVKYGKDLKLL